MTNKTHNAERPERVSLPLLVAPRDGGGGRGGDLEAHEVERAVADGVPAPVQRDQASDGRCSDE